MRGNHSHTVKKECTMCGAELSGRSGRFVCSRCAIQQVIDEGDPIEPSLADSRGPSGSDAETALRSMLEQGPRYRSEREHACGGMGRILIARDVALDREVVVKELAGDDKALSGNARPAGAQETPAPATLRFVREARIAGQLEHPSIVPVHELGISESGEFYYTMKYVRGISFSEALDKAGSLEGRLKLLPHVLDACQGIAYAHSRGVIHRDIKPANIMVGPFGETVLLDWGLARVKGEADDAIDDFGPAESYIDPGDESDIGMTSRGEILGTPAYMSPEQASGNIDAVGERSDIYGLGALLYAVLTGHAPYEGKNRQEILKKVKTGACVAVRELMPGAPGELADICDKAMARKQEDRYRSAEQVAEELQRFLTGGLVSAHEYSFPEHLRRFANRNRAVLATSAMAVLLLLAVGIGSYFRVVGERNVAIEAQQEAQRNFEQAESNLKLADENLALAQGAVYALSNDVSGNDLLKQPRMEPVRRTLLESALAHCERLAGQAPEGDPESLAQLAQAQYRLGEVYELIGQYKEAIAAYVQARDGFTALSQVNSEPPAYQELTQSSLERLGELYRQLGHYSEAIDTYIRAEARIERLAAEKHRDPLISQAELANVKYKLGVTYSEMGLTRKALLLFEDARDRWASLRESQPDWHGPQGGLAAYWQSLALAYRQQGNPEKALTACNAALMLWKDLYSAVSGDAQYKQRIVSVSHELGPIYDDLGRHEEAKRAHEESMRIYEDELSLLRGLTEARPDLPGHQIALAETLANMGVILTRLDNLDTGLARFDEAREVLIALVAAHPDVPRYQATLAALWDNTGAALQQLGENEKALSAWEKARELHTALAEAYPLAPKYLLNLARNRNAAAIAHERMGQDDEARAALKQAREIRTELTSNYPDVGELLGSAGAK